MGDARPLRGERQSRQAADQEGAGEDRGDLLHTAEVADSKARIEDRLGIAVGSFAYPFNRCGQRELEAVARAGYTAGCAGPELSDSLFALARLTVRDSLTWLSFLLVPAYPELRHLYLAATGRDRVRRRATALETFPGEKPHR